MGMPADAHAHQPAYRSPTAIEPYRRTGTDVARPQGRRQEPQGSRPDTRRGKPTSPRSAEPARTAAYVSPIEKRPRLPTAKVDAIGRVGMVGPDRNCSADDPRTQRSESLSVGQPSRHGRTIEGLERAARHDRSKPHFPARIRATPRLKEPLRTARTLPTQALARTRTRTKFHHPFRRKSRRSPALVRET